MKPLKRNKHKNKRVIVHLNVMKPVTWVNDKEVAGEMDHLEFIVESGGFQGVMVALVFIEQSACDALAVGVTMTGQSAFDKRRTGDKLARTFIALSCPGFLHQITAGKGLKSEATPENLGIRPDDLVM